MSQLPPKIPTCMQSHANAAAANKENPSWVDEFLDFSSAKRMTHRRAVSDSITFMDDFTDESNEFDRFYNEEQFIKMFTYDSDNVSLHADMNPSIPSTSSDNNSIDGDKGSEKMQRHEQQRLEDVVKKESEEDQSECTTVETHAPQNLTERLSPSDRQLDPKRVKRILANRQSAQRSRVRKLHYISELERSVTTLQAEVSMLSPRVAFLDHQRLLLNVDNSSLKQRIAALAQDKVFKDATHEALTKEIERLREVMHHQENFQKMENAAESSPRPCDVKSPVESQQQLLNV